MHRHIAIYHTWPEIKNAEYENILRIIAAANNIGLYVSIIDNQGYVLFSTLPGKAGDTERLSSNDTDFTISLHFESPKVIDIYSYYTLWNPLEFYFTWGYEKSVQNFMTHDDLISCDSDTADLHAINLYAAIERQPLLPLPRLHHSLSRSVYKPDITSKARVFYIGINWERINNTRGRHHDLLLALEQADMIDIYGPELFHGVKPWDGFACYRGSIPFDGKSTIEHIAEAGICLAFSSLAHQRSGIMSNRLFEGLAAGALVIANKHPFLEKFFGDLVPTVDDSKSTEEVIGEVKKIVRWVRKFPEEANAKAEAAQQIFLERFALEGTLTALIEGHERRVQHSKYQPLENASVTAVMLFTESRVSRFGEMIANLAAQSYPVESVIIVLDELWFGLNKRKIDAILADTKSLAITFIATDVFDYSGALDQHHSRKNVIGPAVWRALAMIESEFFLLLKPEEGLFVDHVRTLVQVLAREEQLLAAHAGILIESRAEENRTARRLEHLALRSMETYVFANQERYAGSSLFRTSVISKLQEATFNLLDGQEHNYLNSVAFMAGGIGASSAVTYLYREMDYKHNLVPIVAIEQQHQFIRDALRKVARRLEIMRVPRMPEVVFANSTAGSPIVWDNLRRPADVDALLEPGVLYELKSGGEALKFMGSGWSLPEPGGTWIDGRSAALEFKLAVKREDMAKVKKVQFEMLLLGRLENGAGRKQHITFMVNGAAVSYFMVSADTQVYTVEVPGHIFGGEASTRIRFVCDHANPVLNETGKVIDARKLGLRVSSLIAYYSF